MMNQYKHNVTREMIEDGTVITHSIHKYVTDASALRLPPGSFPNLIGTSVGNGQPFYLDRFIGEDAQYKQNCGCITLLVFNS